VKVDGKCDGKCDLATILTNDHVTKETVNTKIEADNALPISV
jgi:hypothetical protein